MRVRDKVIISSLLHPSLLIITFPQGGIYGKNKVLLYVTGNYIQYPVISHNGKEYEKECVCASVIHFAAEINTTM